MSTRTTRVVPTGPSNGYGYSGKHLAQYFDRDMKVWFDIGDPHDTEAEALAAAKAYAENPNPNNLDYLPGDFEEGCSGYYRVWYRRTKPPAGPFWNVREMAKATELRSYPDDGFIVWYAEDEGLSSVPSLNPDDLLDAIEQEELLAKDDALREEAAEQRADAQAERERLGY